MEEEVRVRSGCHQVIIRTETVCHGGLGYSAVIRPGFCGVLGKINQFGKSVEFSACGATRARFVPLISHHFSSAKGPESVLKAAFFENPIHQAVAGAKLSPGSLRLNSSMDPER